MQRSVADLAYDSYHENALEMTEEESKRTMIADPRLRHRCDQCSFRTDNHRSFQLHTFGHSVGQDLGQLIDDSKIMIKQESGSPLVHYKCPICKKMQKDRQATEMHVL